MMKSKKKNKASLYLLTKTMMKLSNDDLNLIVGVAKEILQRRECKNVSEISKEEV